MTVKPINKDSITPAVVAQALADDAEGIEAVYVIAFSKTGNIFKYISGDVKGMAFAGLILQDFALQSAADR